MYSWGATYSTWPLINSGRCSTSLRLPLASKWQKYGLGTSLFVLHMLHFQRRPESMNSTNGLMYVRQRLQRITPAVPKFTVGTGTPSGDSAIGCNTMPMGIPHFRANWGVFGNIAQLDAMYVSSHWRAGSILMTFCRGCRGWERGWPMGPPPR